MIGKKFSLFGLFLYIMVISISFVILYPFYYVLVLSLSNYGDIANSGLFIFPEKIAWSNYVLVFEKTNIVSGFLVSLFVTLVGTFLNMLISTMGAYALSKKHLVGGSFVLILVLISMLFDPGLIPYYLNVKALGLGNSLFSMILPLSVNVFFLFILINYFRAVPTSLEESAKLDGANDIRILFQIVIPTSKAILAAVTLFYAVNRWNEWYHALLFISTPTKYPLQMLLREMLVSIENVTNGAGAAIAGQSVYVKSLQMAAVILATMPIMIVYPFLQKHFTKGVLVGAIKG